MVRLPGLVPADYASSTICSASISLLSSAAYTVDVSDRPRHCVRFTGSSSICSAGATTAALTWPAVDAAPQSRPILPPSLASALDLAARKENRFMSTTPTNTDIAGRWVVGLQLEVQTTGCFPGIASYTLG